MATIGRTCNGLFVVCEKEQAKELANRIDSLSECNVLEIRWLYKTDQCTIIIYQFEEVINKITNIVSSFTELSTK